ncbi:MAG: glycogen-binding domain-containing protein [Spirochaetes bacterium]|jgi:1,4-alpha-glucan branching enzyme|nr:glycogen-binding domain-containing protein [Spirochaetota bacterium]
MKHLTLVFFALVFAGFSPDKSGLRTENYYNLIFLRSAAEPERMNMIKIDGTSRTLRLKKGILFTYKNIEARDVSISGNFSGWNIKKMDRSKHGVWYFFLDSFGNVDRVEYKYYVDGIWIMDPENPEREDDGAGSYLSLAKRIKTEDKRHISFQVLGNNSVEFRLYRPGAKYVSLVGDFNHWNPENDVLKKDGKGIWRIQKRLAKGPHRYKFVVDGKWVPDMYNQKSASDNAGEVCSLIVVE